MNPRKPPDKGGFSYAPETEIGGMNQWKFSNPA